MTDLPTGTMEDQHALVTTEQLRTSGLTDDQITWLTTSGRLVRMSPRVLRLAGAPRSPGQRVLAAVLDAGPGSALSHTSALAWWHVPGFVLDEIHVTHGRDGVHRPKRLATHIHDVVAFPQDHVRLLDGVPVVTPARALFDLAGLRRVHPDRVERAVDNAWSLRLVSGTTLHTMLRDLAKRGRPGIALMRQVLESRREDYIPPASGLEARVVQILKDHGGAPLRRQVNTGDESGWIGRVDFRDPELPLIVEVQSERFHSSLLDQQADAARISRLQTAGFVVILLTDIDVWHRPKTVVKAIREGRWEARRRRAFVLAPETRGMPRVSGARTKAVA